MHPSLVLLQTPVLRVRITRVSVADKVQVINYGGPNVLVDVDCNWNILINEEFNKLQQKSLTTAVFNSKCTDLTMICRGNLHSPHTLHSTGRSQYLLLHCKMVKQDKHYRYMVQYTRQSLSALRDGLHGLHRA